MWKILEYMELKQYTQITNESKKKLQWKLEMSSDERK